MPDRLLEPSQIEVPKEDQEFFDTHGTELCDGLPIDVDVAGLLFQSSPIAGFTIRVGTISAEKYAHVDFIATALEPIKKALDPEPFSTTIDDNISLFLGEGFKGSIGWNRIFSARFPEVVISIVVGRCVPGGDRLLLQSSPLVRNDFVQVDPDHTSESLTA